MEDPWPCSQICCKLATLQLIVNLNWLVTMTEYMSGGSVYDYLHKQKAVLKLPMLLRVAIDISKGMDYLHQNNIIHRDLKAANLLMDENEASPYQHLLHGWMSAIGHSVPCLFCRPSPCTPRITCRLWYWTFIQLIEEIVIYLRMRLSGKFKESHNRFALWEIRSWRSPILV